MTRPYPGAVEGESSEYLQSALMVGSEYFISTHRDEAFQYDWRITPQVSLAGSTSAGMWGGGGGGGGGLVTEKRAVSYVSTVVQNSVEEGNEGVCVRILLFRTSETKAP